MSRNAPLRKVVGTIQVKHGNSLLPITKEVYECGHIYNPKQDIVGITSASKRRCNGCLIGKKPDLTQEQIEAIKI